MENTKARGFNHRESKDGRISAHLSVEATSILKEYCETRGLNCTNFLNQLILDSIPRLQKEQSTAKATCKPHGDRNPAADGKFSPEFDAELSYRIWTYCVATDQNRTEYVKRCVSDRLEVDERKLYIGMSQDQLIDQILKLTRLAGKQEGDRDQGQLRLL